MHEQVIDWVGQFRTNEDLSVLDIGGRDLNGSTRPLFPNANPYHVLDLRPGAGVDFVADAADWRPSWRPDQEATAVIIAYDLVLSTETFEHAKRWPEIIKTAWDVLRPGGWFIFTCAGPGRPAHSGVEAVMGLIGDEWYENVSPEQIREVLEDQGWTDIETHTRGLDTQGKAVKPAAAALGEVLLSATLSRTSGSGS